MGEEEKKYEEPTKSLESVPEPTPTGSKVSGGLKTLFIILAILVPIVGVILGIIWLTKSTKEEKALGKLTLIIAILMWVLGCICWFALVGFGVIGNRFGDYSCYFNYWGRCLTL